MGPIQSYAAIFCNDVHFKIKPHFVKPNSVLSTISLMSFSAGAAFTADPSSSSGITRYGCFNVQQAQLDSRLGNAACEMKTYIAVFSYQIKDYQKTSYQQTNIYFFLNTSYSILCLKRHISPRINEHFFYVQNKSSQLYIIFCSLHYRDRFTGYEKRFPATHFTQMNQNFCFLLKKTTDQCHKMKNSEENCSSKQVFHVLGDLHGRSEVKSNQYKNLLVIVPLRAKQIH